jgi:opacity protein-like surface antigen
MTRKTTLVLICALAAGTAAANDGNWRGDYGPGRDYGRGYDPGAYMGFLVGQLRYNEEGLDTITPATGMFVVGAQLSPNLAIEGRLGTGLASAETNTYGVTVNSMYAGYLKGSVPLSPGFSLYGLAGAAGVDYKRDFGLIDGHDSGLSYGLGMDFDLARNTRLNVEWVRLATGNNLGYDYTVDQAAIGVAWRF